MPDFLDCIPAPGNPSVSLGDAFIGALTGSPDGDAFSLPGVRNLPNDRLSGKTIQTLSDWTLPEDERYAGPMPWGMFRAREAGLEQKYFQKECENGEYPDPALCRMCRRLELVKDGKFTDKESIQFKPFGTWAQLICRTNCMICRLVVHSLSIGVPYSLHPYLAAIDQELQGTQLCPITLPSGENCLAVEYGLRRAGIIRVVDQRNFRDVLRQGYEFTNDCAADFLNDHKSAFHDSTSQKVSTRLISQWIHSCEREHGQSCSSARCRLDAPVDGSILLIDVIDRCLVRSTTMSRYFALSYVWGKVPASRTMKKNLKNRLESGGLPQGLPATIEDAMILVKALGERYIWVDALCIVQDDPDTKNRDIQNMDVIYSKAVATIIALYGTDANAGLPGVRPGTRRPQKIETRHSRGTLAEPDPAWIREYDMLARTDREKHEARTVCSTIGTRLEDVTNLHQHLIDTSLDSNKVRPESQRSTISTRRTRPVTEGILAMVSHPPSLKYVVQTSTWNTRGWTLQERLLSRRCLYFSSDYVYFQCGENTLCETGGNLLTWADVPTTPEAGNAAEGAIALETNPLLHFKKPPPLGTIEYPASNEGDSFGHYGILARQDFDVYKGIIEMYSTRELSVSTDILHALAGILAVVRDRTGADVIAGIPSCYIDLAMLWTPTEPSDRRTPIGHGGSLFPTWSWAGWTGGKQYVLMEDGRGRYRCLEHEYATSEINSILIHHRGRLFEMFKTSESMRATESRNLGRRGSPRERVFPKYIPYSERVLPRVAGPDLGPNILQFWTYAVSGDAFRMAELDGTPLCDPKHANIAGKQVVSRMLDAKDRYCGLLFKPAVKARYRNKSAGHLEFILICSFGESDERRLGLRTMNTNLRPFDERAFPWKGKGSGLVNLMIIEWFDEVAERVSVAQIHRQAWEEAHPIRKHIRLS